jgi:hypothetical protein
MFVGRLNLIKGIDGLSKPENIMNKILLFVHTFFYLNLSNKHCYATIIGFESGFQVSAVRLLKVNIAQ